MQFEQADFVTDDQGRVHLTRRGRRLKADLAKYGRAPRLDSPEAIRAARADLAVLEMEECSRKVP